MKQHYPTLLPYATILLILFLLTGCMKDKCRHSYTLYTPVLKTLTEVRANMKSGDPQPLKHIGKIYTYNNYIFLNERERGIHIIDNSIPENPRNIAFLTIPGNIDMAVNGNTLYADSYKDLITFDITNPKAIATKKITEKAFPDRNYYYNNPNTTNPDSIKVIVDWLERDTVVDCDTYIRLYTDFYAQNKADAGGNYATPGGGKGGSMARFTILKDHLYTVSSSDLTTYAVSNPQDPVKVASNKLGWNIETIYPFSDKLFIGSTTGMFIYDVSNPSAPRQLSRFSHFTSCDPVVADNQYAYITLRNIGTACERGLNQLEIVSIRDLMNPAPQKVYPMASPFGLGKDDDILFVCDGKSGLKIYDARDVNNLRLLKEIGGLNTYDVIPRNKIALVVAADGLYQFNYFNPENIQLISKIPISK